MLNNIVTLKSGLRSVRFHNKYIFKVIESGTIWKLWYGSSIVTMALSCIVCQIYQVNGRKSRNFYTPPVFSASAGSLRRNFAKMFDAYKTGEETMTMIFMLSHFHRILERDGRTDRQTDGHWRAIKTMLEMTAADLNARWETTTPLMHSSCNDGVIRLLCSAWGRRDQCFVHLLLQYTLHTA